jgi:cytochrome c1
MPPMPLAMYVHMTDEELKAIFAYLKSTKPIKNAVPVPVPPVSM